jgi:hypothetical protein
MPANFSWGGMPYELVYEQLKLFADKVLPDLKAEAVGESATDEGIVCREYGEPEDLVIDKLPDLTADPGELVIRVRAAAVTIRMPG